MAATGLSFTSTILRQSPWSPARLFGPAAKGQFLHPAPGLLAQDAAGLVAVTAPGQPVGLIRRAGGTFDAQQALSTARPVFGQDAAGRPYLGFDGIDDCLAASAFSWGSDEVTIIAALVPQIIAGATALVAEFSDGTGSAVGAGKFGLFAPSATSTPTAFWRARGSGNSELTQSFGTFGVPLVLSGLSKISAPSQLRINGTGYTAAANAGTGTFGTWPLHIGSRGGASAFSTMRLYGLLVINRLLNATELAMTERWMAAKCGATLP